MLFKFKANSFWQGFMFKIILIVLGIAVGVGGTFMYIQKFRISPKSASQSVSNVDENKNAAEILEKAGKLIILPKDETPVMATVLDADNLAKKEPFYVGSENGDVVMMYQKALKAIIYSPSRNVIVNVGPVYLPPKDQEDQTGPAGKVDSKSTLKTSTTSTSSIIQKKK